MAFRCPECSTLSLTIVHSIELPPNSRSDEIAVQIVKCSNCGFAGTAVYEESHRGTLGSESFSHIGYRVSAEHLRWLKELIRRCPKPRNSRCDCAAHRLLGQRDAAGRWSALKDIPHNGEFMLTS